MLKTREEIEQWLSKHAGAELEIFSRDTENDFMIAIENWTINNDLSVDVDGDVKLYGPFSNGQLPLRFGNVSGSFDCSRLRLTSLEGAPQFVGGSFHCASNNLTSLEGAPHTVGRSFYCSENKLTNLVGAPQSISGSFYCSNNSLTTLKGAPSIVGNTFACSSNELKNLEGAPEEVGNVFYCHDNPLRTLGNIETQVGEFVISSPIPELTSISTINESSDYHLDPDKFNAKVLELKRIREEKAKLESLIAKVFEGIPHGSVSTKPVYSQTPTAKPKFKL